jgi:selenocysteine lyase/cysteine desulfurase
MDRRGLVRTGLTFAAGALAAMVADEAVERGRSGPTEPAASAAQPSPGPMPEGNGAPPAASPSLDDWDAVRAQFSLTPDFLHFGGLYIASHPAPVREAIERHRQGMDANPVHYLQDNGGRLEAAVLRAAGAYLDADPRDIALTDSTTMGLGLLYNGLDLRAGDEALTTTHDFAATHESLRYKAERTGATVRRIPLYSDPAAASEDQIVAAVERAVAPRTRVVAVTYVHSSTGVKLPIRRIADALARFNAERPPQDRALLCVDGVHGLGVEDITIAGLGADFFVAGCHKWLFGPRGTGIVWGRPAAWERLTPTIPSFSGGDSPGATNTPGGFHSFEHRWALNEAFDFHRRIGKTRIAERIHALTRQVNEGLRAMPHVTVHTPTAGSLSAGLVCFEVAGLAPRAVVQRLRDRNVIATTTPYSPSYARLAAGLLNTPDEVDRALREVRALAT